MRNVIAFLLLLMMVGCSNAANERAKEFGSTRMGQPSEQTSGPLSEAENGRVLPDCFKAATAETWTLMGVSAEQTVQLRALQA